MVGGRVCDARCQYSLDDETVADVYWFLIELDSFLSCERGASELRTRCQGRAWRTISEVTHSMQETGRLVLANTLSSAILSATTHLRDLGDDVLWRLVYLVTGHLPETSGTARLHAYLLCRWVICMGRTGVHLRMRMIRRVRHGLELWWRLLNQRMTHNSQRRHDFGLFGPRVPIEYDLRRLPPMAAGLGPTQLFAGVLHENWRRPQGWTHVVDSSWDTLRDRFQFDIDGEVQAYVDAPGFDVPSLPTLWPHGRLSHTAWRYARTQGFVYDTECAASELRRFLVDLHKDMVHWRPIRMEVEYPVYNDVPGLEGVGEEISLIPQLDFERLAQERDRHAEVWADSLPQAQDYWYVLAPWSGGRSTWSCAWDFLEWPSEWLDDESDEEWLTEVRRHQPPPDISPSVAAAPPTTVMNRD